MVVIKKQDCGQWFCGGGVCNILFGKIFIYVINNSVNQYLI